MSNRRPPPTRARPETEPTSFDAAGRSVLRCGIDTRQSVTAFLLTQVNNGAFRSREPDKAVFVDVSDTLNTPTVIFAGKLISRVGPATNKPAEFIILRISQDTRALEAELAAAGA